MRGSKIHACAAMVLAACGGATATPPPKAPAPAATVPAETVTPPTDSPLVQESEQAPTPDVAADAVATDELRAFVDTMIAAAHASDPNAWGQLLTKKRRERGAKSVETHMKAWQADILKLEPMLRKATLSLEARGDRQRLVFTVEGQKPEALVTVSREAGQLRIDEN